MICSYVVSDSAFISDSDFPLFLTPLTFWLCFSHTILLIYKTQGLCINSLGMIMDCPCLELEWDPSLSSIQHHQRSQYLPTFWPSNLPTFSLNHPHLSFCHFRVISKLASLIRKGSWHFPWVLGAHCTSWRDCQAQWWGLEVPCRCRNLRTADLPYKQGQEWAPQCYSCWECLMKPLPAN